METALATIDVSPNLPATAGQIRQQVNLIQTVIKSVFKEGTHFGTIPGCKKPSLYKPGSEVILTTFRIAVTPEVDDLSTADERRYRVRAVGRTPNGIHVGTGIGECSSNEEKYKWRRAVCDQEYEATDIDRRRVKWATGQGGKPYETKQVRTAPDDVANTVLKMAKKRAQIDLCLTATAASDVFSQDIEDLPEGLELETEEKTIKPTQRKSATAATPHASLETPPPQSEASEAAAETIPFDGEEVIEFVPLDCHKFKFKNKKGNDSFRYEVELPGGRKCSTFDEKMGVYLKEAAAEQIKVRAVIESKEKAGKTYVNFVQVTQAAQ